MIFLYGSSFDAYGGVAWSLFKLGAFLIIMHLSTDDNLGVNMGTYNGLYRLASLVGMLIGGLLVDLIGLEVISFFLGLAVFTTTPFIYGYIPKTLGGTEDNLQMVYLYLTY